MGYKHPAQTITPRIANLTSIRKRVIDDDGNEVMKTVGWRTYCTGCHSENVFMASQHAEATLWVTGHTCKGDRK